MLPIINGEKIINKAINNSNISIIFSFLNHLFALLRRNGVSQPQLSFSTISAVFEAVDNWLHELLIFYFSLVVRSLYFFYLVFLLAFEVQFLLRNRFLNLDSFLLTCLSSYSQWLARN